MSPLFNILNTRHHQLIIQLLKVHSASVLFFTIKTPSNKFINTHRHTLTHIHTQQFFMQNYTLLDNTKTSYTLLCKTFIKKLSHTVIHKLLFNKLQTRLYHCARQSPRFVKRIYFKQTETTSIFLVAREILYYNDFLNTSTSVTSVIKLHNSKQVAKMASICP